MRGGKIYEFQKRCEFEKGYEAERMKWGQHTVEEADCGAADTCCASCEDDNFIFEA